MVKSFLLYFPVFLFLNLSSGMISGQCGPSMPLKWPLGAGLNGLSDFDIDRPFNDVFKTSRGFSTNITAPFSATPILTDSLGWPLVDFGVTVMTEMDSTQLGTYKLRFNGQATISPLLNDYTVENQVYDSLTNTTTADLVFSSAAGFFMSFTNTKYAPGIAGVKNIQIMKPGLGFDAPTFDSIFTAQLSRFACLRFMDWHSTNANTDSLWQNRTHVTTPTQVQTNGCAWEYCIQLANQLHKDLWINVPHMADSEYIGRLARLFFDSLDPQLHIYIEHSNEVWNAAFVQSGYNYNMAEAEAKQPGSILNYDSVNDTYTWSMRRHALRCKQISDIFAGVFGANEVNNRFRVMYGVQYAFFDFTRRGVDFINDYYGDPSKYFYGICIAPYISAAQADTATNADSTAILQALTGDMNNNVYSPYLSAADVWAARSHFYHLHLMCYEGGVDTYGPNNITAKVQASISPAMKDLCYQYLQKYYSYGADGLFNWFTAGAGNWYTQYGTWPLTQHFEYSEKLQAMDSVLASPVQPPAAGLPVTGSIDARLVAGYPSTYANSLTYQPGWNPIDEWLLRVPQDSAGSFDFQVQTAATSAGLYFMAYMDDTLLDTIRVQDSGSTLTLSPVMPVTLQEGLHTLRFRYAGGNNFQVGNLIFTRTSHCREENTGIAGTGETAGLSLFPNPSTGSWQLAVDNDLVGAKLEVFDEQARLVMKDEVRTTKYEIPAGALPAGVYYLRISNDKVSVLRKLVKM